jgi:UPF0755 protein
VGGRTPVTRPRRRGPTREQVLIRRVVAIAALLILLGVLGWAAVTLGVGSGSGSGLKTLAIPPPPKPLKIIFPEGFTRRDMAKRITAVDRIAKHERRITPKLSAKAYLAATAKPRRFPGFGSKRYGYEGFLFPATYDFLPQTTSPQLVAKQLEAFQRNWKQVNLAYARSKNLTPYDVLIIASLVEKEALAPDERAKIAAVIYNRLHAGMNLGIDATTRYGLNVPGTEPLRESQLQSENPYNTRNPNITGLTPTPIANPGLASMQAAAHPAKVNYLYFVRKPDKVHHFFTSSYTEFQNYANAHGF